MLVKVKSVPENPVASLFSKRGIIVAIIVVYVGLAILGAWNVIFHAAASTRAIEKILVTYNVKNEGEQALDRFNHEHPFLGFFIASPVTHELELPSRQQAQEALGSGVRDLLETVRDESSTAAWWSFSLLSGSLLCVVVIIALERSLTSRYVLFALTSISVVFFVIGIFAPAMVIWTAPVIPMESGKVSFVLQHEVRGIAAIIWELLTAGHGIIGGFLLLFSIITPLTKASLTFFVTASHSKPLNYKIGEFLHAIGKWSMADVFVAAILLALYALKFQEATKSIPCLGLYYFIGYCLLSLTTTELLVHSGVVSDAHEKRSKRKIGTAVILALFVLVFCFVSASGVYTYDQYTLNLKQTIKAPASPQQLNNAHLVLPGHK